MPSIVRPDSVESLAEVLANEKGAIASAGAGTQKDFGNPLRHADTTIDLTGLNRITEYNPADLTIHLEAGVTLGQLQHELLANKQFLPLDPWNGPTATIGGIAATNAQGPFRATGTIRDWIIGMKVVHVDGRISKTGGRVVKNVTGYDLAKLYTGSLGTLAVIVEISFKLRAAFGRTVTSVASFSDRTQAAQVLAAIRKSPLQPVCCEWVGPENTIWVRFGEHPRAVDWQIRNLPAADWNLLEGTEEIAAWEKLREHYAAMGPVVVRAVGLPSTLHEIIETYRPQAWIAHALNGIALITVTNPEDIQRMRQKYRVVVERAPLEIRRTTPAFGLTDTEYEMMQKLKNEFDPEGRLNPGRHVDGERR